MAEKTAQQQFEEWMAGQSGYIGKSKKADWWNSYNQGQQTQSSMNNIFSNETPKFTVGGGSAAEQSGRIEGLQRAKVLTGQNPYEIGQDYQEAYGNIKKRTQLADTGSELIRNSKAGAVADARNQLQQQGVKGGAALGAVSAIERSKSYDVNNQLMENQRKAEMDFLNASKANANFTTANEMNFGAMAAGKDFQAPGVNSNGFGTVICTVLYHKGMMDTDTYMADHAYGLETMDKRPEVYRGYRFLANPIARRMWDSDRLCKVVSLLALPWARNMAGDKNLLGALVSLFGETLCFIVGTIIGGLHANQKA